MRNILITGRPRVGKSTLIKRVVEGLKERGYTALGGFYTLEIREGGERKGFEIHTLDGRKGILAHVDIESPVRLGKYGIDLEEFEHIAIPCLEDAIKKGFTIVIDEIGYMELKSRRFRELVLEAMDSPSTVVATVTRSKLGFTERLKSRPDVTLVTVRVDNRDSLPPLVIGMVLDAKG
ncbi:MAG TPA: NTPase [Deltaproteobacteria bacterium]|nr:NTPase [Deltaproteobacteria bacterium]